MMPRCVSRALLSCHGHMLEPTLQVFMTDTKFLLTEPVTHAGGPVLSLTKDTVRDLLWVSTPSSTLCAWAPPSGPPSHPVHAVDLQAHPDPDPTDPPHMPSPRATPLRALSLPRERLPTAPKKEPLVTLKGLPPLVRCAAFEDRRHVLTQDAAGCIALWDLVQGKPVKQYSQDKVCPSVRYHGPTRVRAALSLLLGWNPPNVCWVE